MEGLIITPELRAHVEMAVFNERKKRAKQGLNQRKDYKLDLQVVFDHVKEQVRPFTPPSLSLQLNFLLSLLCRFWPGLTL